MSHRNPGGRPGEAAHAGTGRRRWLGTGRRRLVAGRRRWLGTGRRRWLVAGLAGVTVLAVAAGWALVTGRSGPTPTSAPADATGTTPGPGGDRPAPSGTASPTPRPDRPATSTPGAAPARPPAPRTIKNWAYQLQGYSGGGLDALTRGRYQLAVVDLARDAHTGYFSRAEIGALRRSGKRVLAYFEIGSIEDFRPEYPVLRRDAPDLLANEWPDWPGEYFVHYWDGRWWERVVRPRVDRALRAGFDGVYLDTPLAYEEIALDAAGGRDRARLAVEMAALVVRISAYAKARRPGFLIVPQNSPELRRQSGYTAAIDGIAMEELFYLAMDEPCTRDWCAENLAHTRALRDAGKFVLAVDYAVRADHVRAACDRYRAERFAGTVTVRELDRLTAPCG
ncbi:endo alpha-1,4 polygalactosaminidase [Micromonospora sp. WMMD1102]|uniref:endo alpha-1,4 polygalactosaminidase n=1 Tax=Micromonospora sp. WMMD1102 TaxID=3016105 RepID=UPI002414F5A9|nr:endo alpha-1,4 polygalactosaminidase [Micromonospora sp. WMMD1102]MDG4786021.1 endo alpha-1,4 polygalactosaminidase [Micromonospora sp. WMMD1102]